MAELRVDVRAYLSLAPLVGSGGRREVAVPEGSTVGDVGRAAGLAGERLGMILVNGCKAGADAPVSQEDRIAFFPDYVPYHKAYGMCVL